MNFQTFIVAAILLAACFYVGKMLWRKIKSFSATSSCGADCGCEGSRPNKTAKF